MLSSFSYASAPFGTYYHLTTEVTNYKKSRGN